MSYHDFYQQMAKNIERVGRSCLYVMDQPPFCYTIGNQKINLPELIVLGLGPDQSITVLNGWSEHMRSIGREFQHGELVDVGGRFPCMAIQCGADVRKKYTLQAGRYFHNEDYRVTQMLVPDKEGRQPNNPTCAPEYRVPILGPVPCLT